VEVQSEVLPPDLSGVIWRKSTRSGPNCDNCVEIAAVPGAVAVRDSKDAAGPALVFTPGQWSLFLAGAKGGEFDRG